MPTSSRLTAALIVYGLTVLFAVTAPTAQQGGTIRTITVPPELPIEVETELAPAGSLKQAPLWQELAQLLTNPDAISCPPDDPETLDDESVQCVANIVRRPAFRQPGDPRGPNLPPLNVWSPCFNTLTGQPLRLRTSDGEISWDQPGLLFSRTDPGNFDPSTPVTQTIGRLVVNEENELVVERFAGVTDEELPETGTVVAVPGCNDEGEPLDEDGTVIDEFELPISELDFFRPTTDTAAVPLPLRPFIGRSAAQALGKALFWDMQVGSDGVQACGSCHFHAGTDNRTKNQLNPNHLGGDLTLQVHATANQDLVAADYPFRRLANIDGPSEQRAADGTIVSNHVRDANDVMSSMGVRFRKFGDIPVPGGGPDSPAFVQTPVPAGWPKPLAPDCAVPMPGVPQRPGCAVTAAPDATSETDPIPVFQGFRRVEPRNTPTIFGPAFFFDNFWDGRARHDANGGSVFGPADPQFHIFINGNPSLNVSSPADPPRGAEMMDFRSDLAEEDPEVAEQPVRIRFSSLASLATGPALSDFEMSFAGRNWPKVGKKLLQTGVTPLANQLVASDDSVLGPFSNQGGSVCAALGRPTAAGMPGLCVNYTELIRAAFIRNLWSNSFAGASTFNAEGHAAPCTSAVNGVLTPAGCDPFDGYVLSEFICCFVPSSDRSNTNLFRQIEANFSLFFGLSLQAWQLLLIPDDTPFDRFIDANPKAAFAVAQPGEMNTLPPSQIPVLVGPLTFPDPDLFGPDELFGLDIFGGANLTAALPPGSPRNPLHTVTGADGTQTQVAVGSNPFLRTGRCMLCHFGPEQSDHTNNVNAGLMLSDTEFEWPREPNLDSFVGPEDSAPEPTGPFRVVTGIALAEEVEENAQDGVELELRNFATFDDPSTPTIDERVIAFPGAFSFQDNGVYNIGVRPTNEDIMRGGNDAFGWPLSLASLSMKNLAGADFEPCDTPDDPGAATQNGPPQFAGNCTGPMSNFDPGVVGFNLFEPTGADQRINPGLAMDPINPMLPEYLAPWVNNLPAGELSPQIDELSVAPNTITEPVAGPVVEFAEILFGSDQNCGTYDPGQFGAGPPNFGFGPLCPNAQTGIPVNFEPPLNGTWPFENRVARLGAVKVPQLRNVELTGPYFHTGSYLTLRQIVDFYVRGGDFPLTNGEDRDPNLVDLTLQAFGFGATNNAADLPPELQDGFPDAISQYGPMPDTISTGTMDSFTGTPTPEYATQEDAKVSLVKFLLSLTDQRVKFERAPFDHPEIFVPLDGTAPDNGALGGAAAGGREGFLNNLVNGLFRHVPAVGSAGSATPLPGFLGVTTNPLANCVSEISHFCR